MAKSLSELVKGIHLSKTVIPESSVKGYGRNAKDFSDKNTAGSDCCYGADCGACDCGGYCADCGVSN